MLEDMFPDATKIELFARNARDGWSCWGNEVPNINETERKREL
jgi:N6-adenosine-specific RNA methylase IME4